MEEHVHGTVFPPRLQLRAIFIARSLNLVAHFVIHGNLQVFSTAAFDEHKNIVLLAFEIVEKIVREYFPYITETETTTFTDFVNCLIAFANSRFNKDVSLNAIGFLRVCATKLAEGEVGMGTRNKESSGKTMPSSPHNVKSGKQDGLHFIDKDDNQYFWFPLLVGTWHILKFDSVDEQMRCDGCTFVYIMNSSIYIYVYIYISSIFIFRAS